MLQALVEDVGGLMVVNRECLQVRTGHPLNSEVRLRARKARQSCPWGRACQGKA